MNILYNITGLDVANAQVTSYDTMIDSERLWIQCIAIVIYKKVRGEGEVVLTSVTAKIVLGVCLLIIIVIVIIIILL